MDITPADRQRILDVNLRGVLYLSQAFIPHMRERKQGSIVCMSSVSAQRGGGIFGGPHYSAAKAGVLGLAKAMARELGPDGIRVNCVTPGLIQTDITGGKLTDEMRREILKGIPLEARRRRGRRRRLPVPRVRPVCLHHRRRDRRQRRHADPRLSGSPARYDIATGGNAMETSGGAAQPLSNVPWPSGPTASGATRCGWARCRGRATSPRRSASPTCWPWPTFSACATGPNDPRLGGARPLPPVDRPLRHRALRGADRGRRSCPRTSSRPTAPTTAACRCRAWPPTRRAWRSAAARSATACRSPSASALALKRKKSKSLRLQPVLRRRARRGLDLGGGDVRRPLEARQPDRHRRRQQHAGRRPSTQMLGFEPLAPKFEAFGWHVQRVDGNDIDALVPAFDAARSLSEPRAAHHHLRHQDGQRRAVPGGPRADPFPAGRAGRMAEGAGCSRRREASMSQGDHRRPGGAAQVPEQGEGGQSRQAAAHHLGDDRLARRTGPAHQARAVRPRARGAGRDPARDRRAHRRSRQVHGPAHLRPGAPRPLLPDGHGRAAADGDGRRHGARGLHALRHHLCGVRVAPRLRLHLPRDRRGEAQRQDRLRAAGPHHRLRPEPPGDRGHRDLPRHAQPDDHRSLRRARDRAGGAGDRGPRRPGLHAPAARQRPAGARRVRLPVRARQGEALCATAATC